MDDSAFGAPGQPTAFQIRLVDGSNMISPSIWVDAFTDLEYPSEAVVIHPMGQGQLEITKSSMATARIPLRYFTGVNLADIHRIEILFASTAHPSGEVLLDSIELVP